MNISRVAAILPDPLLRIALASKFRLAALYRPFLRKTCFVGITGSCGKSTTKNLIGAVLESRGPVRVSQTLTNSPDRVANTVLRVRPWDRFCVQEMGGFAPGVLKRSTALVRPRIGVVTHVGFDHYTSFRGLENTAREKGVLVEALPADGTAVLNADDPRVAAMRGRTGARVITFGLSPEAMLRGFSLSSVWPEPLSLEVEFGAERVPIRTRLFGEHWAFAVLAAVGAGLAAGVSLSEAATAIESVDPLEGRMKETRSADGVTFLVDAWKAPLWTIPAVVRFMASARAARKIIVLGTISDYPGAAEIRYRQTAREALKACNLAVFVGPNAHLAAKEGRGESQDRLASFDTIEELARFLRKELRPEDLVLLKGSRIDHLERLALDRAGPVRCWRSSCKMWKYCGHCRRRWRSWPRASRRSAAAGAHADSCSNPEAA